MYKEKRWWQTYDYLTGNSYILGEKFSQKGQAMAFAKSCGMAVLPQSTRALTDEEKELKILREKVREYEIERM